MTFSTKIGLEYCLTILSYFLWVIINLDLDFLSDSKYFKELKKEISIFFAEFKSFIFSI